MGYLNVFFLKAGFCEGPVLSLSAWPSLFLYYACQLLLQWKTMINLLERGVDCWMLTPMLTQKMDLQFFTSRYKERKTNLAFILGFCLFVFQLAPHRSTLFWPCRSTESYILRLKSRLGSPCPMLPLGSVPYRRQTFCLQDLTMMCIPTWSTEQLLCFTTLSTEHRSVQGTDPTACLCRGFGRPMGFSHRRKVCGFTIQKHETLAAGKHLECLCESATQQDLIGLLLCPARRKGDSEMNCSAEDRLASHPCWWQEDVRRRGGEKDQKCQELVGLVGRRTGVTKCITPDRGKVENLPMCITVATQ